MHGVFRAARLTGWTMMPCQVVSVASAPGKDVTDISQGGKPYLRAQSLGLFTGRTIKGTLTKPGTVVHVYNPRTGKAEVAELQVQG